MAATATATAAAMAPAGAAAEATAAEGHDPTQAALMEERIVVVDAEDRALRAGSKRECHLNDNIDGGLLHRAFSVFLFNSEGKLLLQQRSDKKITFPLFWANTCCSHPLYTPAELELENALGVKRAAVRKLGHELGIAAEELPLDKFQFLTRIHYVAKEAGTWGEHEIDHVLVIQADVTLNPEPNEVAEARYFDEAELDHFFKTAEETGTRVSPWFGHIKEKFLSKWWAALRSGDLEACADRHTIHRIPPASEATADGPTIPLSGTDGSSAADASESEAIGGATNSTN
mmetsp:Transcript_11440/g.36647  ORF Transcript_11440/g.36647 Transcript_11440/m.36647 type:complete len:288 (+) Transcript_11440:1-864(+)